MTNVNFDRNGKKAEKPFFAEKLRKMLKIKVKGKITGHYLLIIF